MSLADLKDLAVEIYEESDIGRTQLKSLAVRQEITGEAGVRIYGGTSTAQADTGLLGTIIGTIKTLFKGIVTVGGWIINFVFGAFSFSCSAIFGILVSAVTFLWNFDWNTPDKTLDEQVKQMNLSMAILLGGAVGNTIGWLLCGIVPGAILLRFNEALALKVLRDVGEEAFDELVSNVRNICREGVNIAAATLLIESYKNVRRLIKTVASDPHSPAGKILVSVFGNNITKAIEAWGKGGDKPWSFAQKFQDTIQAIPDQWWQNFTEELFEEGFEACLEAGYVFTSSVDGWLAQQKMQKELLLGSSKAVEIIPNRKAPEEKFVLEGKEELLRPTILNTINLYEVTEDRDIGQYVGYPLAVELRRSDISNVTLKITYRAKQTPPYIDLQGKQLALYEVSIPNVPRSHLDYDKIRKAAGGSAGLEWGRFKAIARFENKRSIVAFGDSSASARANVMRFIELTASNEIKGLTINELTEEGQRATGQPFHKSPITLYPAKMTILVKIPATDKTNVSASFDSTFHKRQARIPLWMEIAPPDFSETINRLFIAS